MGTIAQWVTDKHRWLLGLALGIHGVFALLRAMRQLWYDELFTFYMSTLPDWSAIWGALKDGADLNPPFFYIVTRLSITLFGANEIATRLPGFVGYAAAAVAVYRFSKSLFGPPAGLLSALLLLGASSAEYAAEGRAYGLLLGLTAWAIFFWQRATASPNAVSYRLGLSLLLTLALLTHCYGVLVMIPFGVGCLVRWWRIRKVERGLATAVMLPGFAVVSYLPLMSALGPVAMDNIIFRPAAERLPRFYAGLIQELTLPAIGALVLIALSWRRANAEPEERADRMPSESWALSATFLLIPLFAWLLALTATRVFMERYGLPAVLGIAILPPCMIYLAPAGRRFADKTTALCCLFFLASLAYERMDWVVTQVQLGSAKYPVPFEQTERPELPLVLANGLDYLEMNHYANEAIRGRMQYLLSEETARELTGSDVFDKSFPIMRRWFPMRAPLVPYAEFLAKHREFLVLSRSSHPLEWLIQKLEHDGARIVKRHVRGVNVIYLVTLPGLKE
jgi:hypothetical protein